MKTSHETSPVLNPLRLSLQDNVNLRRLHVVVHGGDAHSTHVLRCQAAPQRATSAPEHFASVKIHLLAALLTVLVSAFTVVSLNSAPFHILYLSESPFGLVHFINPLISFLSVSTPLTFKTLCKVGLCRTVPIALGQGSIKQIAPVASS